MRRPLVALIASVGLAACGSTPAAPPDGGLVETTVFEGARLIADASQPPIDPSAVVVSGDTITAAGAMGRVEVPPSARRVDLSGKTVMPALVDAHSHLGYTDVKAMTTAAANFTRDNLMDHLRRYAYYGVAATLSMGVDRGELPYDVRRNPAPEAALFRTAGRGIALPDAGPGADYRRDAAYGVSTEAEARAAVRELAARQVDIVKIWVDDRGGTVPKLPPAMYRAIIDEAHQHGLRVTAHIFDLADAKELVRAGIDGFAHGVRDRDIDDEFVALMKAHPNVWLIPNLPERDTGDDYAWLADTVPHAEVDRLRAAAASRTPAAARQARALYDVQSRNLKRLSDAGVVIGYGTDAGVSVGWNALTELSDMAAAGLTPAQVLTAATKTSAAILRLDRLGTIAPGKSADFMVLDANPLDSVDHARRISRVYLRGREVNRAALRAAWTASGS